MKKAGKKNFAIIGDPVGHSLSPAMHNAAFRALKLPHEYRAVPLKVRELPKFFKKVEEKNYAGLNVTVPHKESVIPFLKKLSPEARRIGAVNTITLGPEGSKGFNTDGAGYLLSLQEEAKFSPKNKSAVLIGAGGAARAILAALCGAGLREATLANRTLSKAKILQKEFSKKFPKAVIRVKPLNREELKSSFEKADLLVNTSSAGMKGQNPLPSLPLSSLKASALVSDIVYRPLETSLLKRARKLRLRTLGGLSMLLHQGALAFELWTGKKAPLRVMRNALLSALKRQRKYDPGPG